MYDSDFKTHQRRWSRTLVAAHEVQGRLVEERYLLAAQGDSYRTHAHHVARFAPGIGPHPLIRGGEQMSGWRVRRLRSNAPA